MVLMACAGPGGTLQRERSSGARELLVSVVEGAHPGISGAGPLRPDETLARRRAAECRRARAELWRVLAPVRTAGAEVEVMYWVDGGALTMLAWRRLVTGDAPGNEVDDFEFARSARNLCTFIGDGAYVLRLVERREQSGWIMQSVHSEPEGEEPPPEAKTLPVEAPEVAAGTFATLEKLAGERWLPLMRVRSEGTARLELAVELEDERVAGLSVGSYRASGRGVEIGGPAGLETEIAGALVGFTQGVGRRTVRAVLEARREPGDKLPRWRVVGAATVHPPGVEKPAPFTTGAEYLKLHEEVLRNWREEMAGTAVLAASFTVEQLALWVVGGWAARGMGALLEIGAGPVMRVLGRGGLEAAQWMETLLERLPPVEREAFARLWTKAEMEGARALSVGERAELQAAFRKMDGLVETPLTALEKENIGSLARRRFWPDLARKNPEVMAQIKRSGHVYEVHHRFTLEFAHLHGEADINDLSNLCAVEKTVHYSIGKVWTVFRSAREGVTLADVHEAMAIVDRHYGR